MCGCCGWVCGEVFCGGGSMCICISLCSCLICLICFFRFKQVADKGLLKRGGAAFGYECGGGVAVEHFASVHHGHAVAALGFVHEVGGDEDGDAVAP